MKTKKRIPKNDWRRKLRPGDEVTIDTGHPESSWPSDIILEIEYFPDDTVKILTTSGERLNPHLSEIA